VRRADQLLLVAVKEKVLLVTAPATSASSIVNAYVVALFGRVPERTPVAGAKVMPAGRELPL